MAILHFLDLKDSIGICRFFHACNFYRIMQRKKKLNMLNSWALSNFQNTLNFNVVHH